jgi:hypothetical protein
MPVPADNPATLPIPSACLVELANTTPQKRNGGGGLRSSYGVPRGSKKAAITMESCSQNAEENFALAGVSRNVFWLVLGHCFGPVQRPAARRSSASATPPSGLRFPPSADPP